MKSDDICKLVELHYAGDDDGFTAKLKEVMDAEGQSKHHTVAWEMRMAMNHGLDIRANPRRWIRLDEFGCSSDVAQKVEPKFAEGDIILTDEIRNKMDRIASEHAYIDKLRLHGMDSCRKVLLYGPSGTGKTMTGSILAQRLKMDFYVARTDFLIDSRLGASAKNIKSLFQQIKAWPGVYLIDEFDTIGARRQTDGDSCASELRRIVNEFLQLIESDDSSSIILCATNMFDILDFALFRRFDEVIEYDYPDKKQRKALIESLVKRSMEEAFSQRSVEDILNESNGMSHANIKAAVLKSMKDAILADAVGENGIVLVNGNDVIENLALRREMVANGTKQEKMDGQPKAVS